MKLVAIETHTITSLDERTRLSDYAGGIFELLPSRKGMKKAIDKGLVRLNGKTAFTGDYVSTGDVIELLAEQKKSTLIDLDLTVLFEDEHLAVVHKPAGIEVSGNKKITLENGLSSNLKPSDQKDALSRPQPIHRLDYPTTGALLIGKTRSAVVALNGQFENRTVSKTYMAVCIGEMPEEGTISTPIADKECKSSFTVISSVPSERFGKLNLVKLTPHTGRRHQLRIHMASLGHPILGDKDYYSDGLILRGKGLYLHSYSLGFMHPVAAERLDILCELPKKFGKLFV